MSPGAAVLVVDDQEDIRDMARLVLSGAGYLVSVARSGTEALRLVRAARFDLVLLDVNMPVMDGWTTLRLLRADDDLSNLPVAMFSVKCEVKDKISGLQDGAIDYITKPFAVDDFLSRVSRILDSAGRRPPTVPTASGS